MIAAPVVAFCGFFVSGADAKLMNDASQVVLLRKGNHTVMTMSNNYKGPAEDFAMVVPVPVVLKKEQVKTLAPTVFDHIDQLTAPRLVEYWEEDPCAPDVEYDKMMEGAVGGVEGGVAGGTHGVKVLAKFEVGEYQILILSAKESGGLETWLREHKYRIPDGAADALAPYIREQAKFFVAKVDAKKVKRDAHGAVVLSPLRFDFESSELRLPVRLGLLNAQGKQDLVIYVLSDRRFEVANYKNVFIPTNLDVVDEVRRAFAQFYAQLFDATLAQAGGKAVVTEYSWDTASCDPCPGPPLEPAEVAALGGEGGQWVVTRLHTRYDRQTLSDDLVFRAAQPIMGGREGVQSTAPSPVNNFQARYIIRHYWTGKVACQNPTWNRWGDRGGNPSAARDLAAAPRGKIQLANVVDTPVPELKLAGHKHRRGK
jgi:hypothetical protein